MKKHVEFYDNEGVYGIITVEESDYDRLCDFLEEYRNAHPEDYDIDNFYQFLGEKGFAFEAHPIAGDFEIYF